MELMQVKNLVSHFATQTGLKVHYNKSIAIPINVAPQKMASIINIFQCQEGSFQFTPRKYLSSKWIKGDVSRCILVLDTSLLVHFDDKYFQTEGVLYWS